jgi:predicted ArsR family transcriptional regulator
MERADLDRQIGLAATLREPVRREIYRYVAAQPGDVSRDQAARVVGISRGLAAYHLDSLVEAGLLEVSFRRLSGRRGPGAGRPAKLYRRSRRQLELSLPQRSYGLAAVLLAQAVETSGAASTEALRQAAHAFGLTLGQQARRRCLPRPKRECLLREAQGLLEGHGFEPYLDEDVLRLRNCPFDSLVAEHRELVCGMNLSLMEGFLDGLRVSGVTAILDPQPGTCCVALPMRGGRGAARVSASS